jgi:hypothetical protein
MTGSWSSRTCRRSRTRARRPGRRTAEWRRTRATARAGVRIQPGRLRADSDRVRVGQPARVRRAERCDIHDAEPARVADVGRLAVLNRGVRPGTPPPHPGYICWRPFGIGPLVAMQRDRTGVGHRAGQSRLGGPAHPGHSSPTSSSTAGGSSTSTTTRVKRVAPELGEITDSDRIAELRRQWFNLDLHHLRVSFDEHGTYQVMCLDFRVEYRAAAATAQPTAERPDGWQLRCGASPDVRHVAAT